MLQVAFELEICQTAGGMLEKYGKLLKMFQRPGDVPESWRYAKQLEICQRAGDVPKSSGSTRQLEMCQRAGDVLDS